MKRFILTLIAAAAFQSSFASPEVNAQVFYYPRGPMLNPPAVQPPQVYTWEYPAPSYNPYVTPYPTYGILPPFLTAHYGWDLSGNVDSTENGYGYRRTAEDYGYSLDRQPRRRPGLYPAIPYKASEDVRRVRFEITVPPGATVLMDGVQTSQTGANRSYITPPLDPDRLYTSTIEVRWSDAGGPRSQRKTFEFTAGETKRARFPE